MGAVGSSQLIHLLGLRGQGCGSANDLNRGEARLNGDNGWHSLGVGSDEEVSESDGGNGVNRWSRRVGGDDLGGTCLVGGVHRGLTLACR